MSPTRAADRTPTLASLLDELELERAIVDGLVRRQHHPTEPLAILNYTERAAYAGAWSEVTTLCRGLIYHTGTGAIVARPFRKFFNAGQAGAAEIAATAPVHVTDKLDGSLGIVHALPSGGWAVATRGSFASDQAAHATAIFADRYAPVFTPPSGLTLLVEILYPDNRIVVDYGPLDDLVLLGAVVNATGEVLDPARVAGWPGPVVRTFTAPTYVDALALPPRPNAEGIVVRCLATGAMVKVKQSDYVELHRLVTGLSARVVWQHLVDGRPLAELTEPLPDELHPWVEAVAAELMATVAEQEVTLRAAFDELVASLPVEWTRREFAAHAVPRADSWAMFRLLDGQDLRDDLLRRARPEGSGPPADRAAHTEDTA